MTPSNDHLIKFILEGTGTAIGSHFFAELVKNLTLALHMDGAWVSEYLKEKNRLRSLAFWAYDKYIYDYEYAVENTPCEEVIESKELICIPDRVINLFPKDPDVQKMGMVSYMGVPLLDVDNEIMGHLAVFSSKTVDISVAQEELLTLFGQRATAELRRLNAESKLFQREQKLSRLIASALDGIIELDRKGNITLMNPSAEKTFEKKFKDVKSTSVFHLFDKESQLVVKKAILDLEPEQGKRQTTWLPQNLRGIRNTDDTFPVEASLSCYLNDNRPFYLLILRDTKILVEAKKELTQLRKETTYLREEIHASQNQSIIIGRSKHLRESLRQIAMVAPTNTTVLLLGETGTGKELFARAIHDQSSRKNKPLIKVNCAAIPSTLIESEFFGHEKGAFTGATAKREGKFAIADGGTIFLDEVGEIPLELQAKLLRIIQEGEFEPLGGNKLHKVDVRIVAATNRDLEVEVKNGKFREDLYYRLSVFPVKISPLRHRGDDAIYIAINFIENYQRKAGKPAKALSEESKMLILSYSWPGNVRELLNVMERAIILSDGDTIDLKGMLSNDSAYKRNTVHKLATSNDQSVLTRAELLEIEKMNIVNALAKCQGRISGSGGAAELLGIPSSTLTSRIKSLGLK